MGENEREGWECKSECNRTLFILELDDDGILGRALLVANALHLECKLVPRRPRARDVHVLRAVLALDRTPDALRLAEAALAVSTLGRKMLERLDRLHDRRGPDLELTVPNGAEEMDVAAHRRIRTAGESEENGTHFCSSVGFKQSRAVSGASGSSSGGGGQRMQ